MVPELGDHYSKRLVAQDLYDSVLIALYATKVGANTLFHRYTEDDPDDPNVDDSDSFASRLRQHHRYGR